MFNIHCHFLTTYFAVTVHFEAATFAQSKCSVIHTLKREPAGRIVFAISR